MNVDILDRQMRPAFLVDSGMPFTHSTVYSIPRRDQAGSRTTTVRISKARSLRLYLARKGGYEVGLNDQRPSNRPLVLDRRYTSA